jgi:hypothetical protein
MNYDDWKKKTYSRTKRRSKELKSLDETIKEYSKNEVPAVLMMVKQTFEVWKRSKGLGEEWKRSSRNDKHALTQLHNELNGINVHEDDMDNARLGIIYFLGNIRGGNNNLNLLLQGGLSVASSGLAIASALGPSAPKVSFENALQQSYNPVSGTQREGQSVTKSLIDNAYKTSREHESEKLSLSKIISMLMEYVKKIGKDIFTEIQKISNQPTTIFHSDMAVKALKNLITVLAKQLFDKLKGQVGGGLNVFKGIVNTTNACAEAVKAYHMRMGVQLMPGHPGAICDAIHKSLNYGICYGLYDLLKGSAVLGASFLGGVGSTIFNLVVSIIETITRLLYRIKEMKKINAFLAETSTHWAAYRKGAEGNLHQKTSSATNEHAFATPATPGFHTSEKFHSWFRANMLEMPILAALCMHSGICGDKMRFLNMMTYDMQEDKGTSEKRFHDDVAYLDNLKQISSSMLSKSPYKFWSELKDVNAYINNSKKFIQDSNVMIENNKIGVSDFITKFANS